ncbi:DUF6517 family protein [Natronorubrum texcoconense]|uniref:Uncharacterized protein n=1 Tax=Natronorubrum texcoconense TaxID=1095776 RepID=A0A1G9GY22_9EURY|nr:DUF6517 family protein [Natronorubrum texcoconense]SDL05173.1 hypothetical protein SAMN04515672_0045 [Natronorubrum texcoconense]
MTVTRRDVLVAGATAGAGALAGCSGALEDSLSSMPAVVSPSALEETGYSEHAVEEVVVERTISRFGFKRSISVTNWYAEYDRSLSLGLPGLSRVQAAVVSVLTTPQVSFLGRTFNPVGEFSTDELVEMMQDRYDELEDVDRVDESSVSILGTETTLVRYTAAARLIPAATTIDVYVQLTEPVSHGDDFVIGVAVYPQVHGFETESGAVRTLLERLEHE